MFKKSNGARKLDSMLVLVSACYQYGFHDDLLELIPDLLKLDPN